MQIEDFRPPPPGAPRRCSTTRRTARVRPHISLPPAVDPARGAPDPAALAPAEHAAALPAGRPPWSLRAIPHSEAERFGQNRKPKPRRLSWGRPKLWQSPPVTARWGRGEEGVAAARAGRATQVALAGGATRGRGCIAQEQFVTHRAVVINYYCLTVGKG